MNPLLVLEMLCASNTTMQKRWVCHCAALGKSRECHNTVDVDVKSVVVCRC